MLTTMPERWEPSAGVLDALAVALQNVRPRSFIGKPATPTLEPTDLERVRSARIDVATEAHYSLVKVDTRPIEEELVKQFGPCERRHVARYEPGMWMGWHTNHSVKGRRYHMVHAAEGRKSFLRYQDPCTGEIVTDWDEQGWNFRTFTIGEPDLWHCVWSNTWRISIGFRLNRPS